MNYISTQPRHTTLRALAAGSVVVMLVVWALAIAGAMKLGPSFLERRIAVRLLGLAFLFSIVLVAFAIWCWRRARYLASLSPEYTRSLMKVRRGGEWFAEGPNGAWKRWDSLAADWVPSAPPDDGALLPRAPKMAAPPPPPKTEEPAPAPEADLAIWQARRASEERRAKMRRIRIAAHIGAGLSLLLLGLLLVAIVVAMIAGVGRFLSDLPF